MLTFFQIDVVTDCSLKIRFIVNPNIPLTIQKIENKEDGVVLIKINVSKNAAQDQIESDFWQSYEFSYKVLEESNKELLLENNRYIDKENRYINQLFYSLHQAYEKLEKIPELISEATTKEAKFINSKSQENKLINVAKANRIQAKYLSEAREITAELAAEIQKLLKQLEKTNPSATVEQQKSYLDAAISSTLKERCVSVLKADNTNAIEEFLENTYIDVGKALVQDWLKLE